jgi:hypothetical protein
MNSSTHPLWVPVYGTARQYSGVLAAFGARYAKQYNLPISEVVKTGMSEDQMLEALKTELAAAGLDARFPRGVSVEDTRSLHEWAIHIIATHRQQWIDQMRADDLAGKG